MHLIHHICKFCSVIDPHREIIHVIGEPVHTVAKIPGADVVDMGQRQVFRNRVDHLDLIIGKYAFSGQQYHVGQMQASGLMPMQRPF